MSEKWAGFIIIMAVLGVLWTTAWLWRRTHPEPEPLFCTECGCPVVERWEHAGRYFDPQTRVGTRYEERVLRCTSTDRPKWPHTERYTGTQRTFVVEPACQDRTT